MPFLLYLTVVTSLRHFAIFTEITRTAAAAAACSSSKQTGKVAPFTVGCPACLHNFVQLWCFLSCSSDQSTFTNVTQVQLAADNNATAVKEIDVWASDEFTNSLYDSCKVSHSRRVISQVDVRQDCRILGMYPVRALSTHQRL